MDEPSSKATGVATWRERARVLRAFFTVDRIVAAVAVLLIPCMLFAWVHIPLGTAAGFNITFSVPDLVSTSSKVVERVEDVAEVRASIEHAVSRATDVIERGTQVLDSVSAARDNLSEARAAREEGE